MNHLFRTAFCSLVALSTFAGPAVKSKAPHSFSKGQEPKIEKQIKDPEILDLSLSATSSDLPYFIGTFSAPSDGISIFFYDHTGYNTFGGSNEYLVYFDASVPTKTQAPQISGTVNFGFTPNWGVVYGTTGYVVASGDTYIGYFDASLPQSGQIPTQIGTITTLANTSFIALHGTTCFVSLQNQTIGYFDASLAAKGITPTINGSFSAVGNLSVIDFSEDIGYVLTRAGATRRVSYFDASLPAKGQIPQVIGTFSIPFVAGYLAITPNGQNGYISFPGSNMIGYFDPTLPSSGGTPSIIGTFSALAPFPLAIAFNGDYGYVGCPPPDTIGYFDATVPVTTGTPSISGTFFADYPNGIAFYEDTGYTPSRFGMINYFFAPLAPSSGFPEIPGNAGVVASMFNQLNGNTNTPLQTIIADVAGLTGDAQIQALNDLAPQFKILQYTTEKLDLLLHKELDGSLYCRKKGTTPFVIAGYDHLHQDSKGPYTGYSVDNYYQMVGVTGDISCVKVLSGLGASESYVSEHPGKGNADYTTVWGTLGLASHHKKWSYGVSGLFGYSFINAERKIEFLDVEAHTSHGAWNVSADARVAYQTSWGTVSILPYDNVGYLYGYENSYHEHGAGAADLSVKNEHISVFRNSLGIMFDAPKDSNVKFFLDGAWVYEHYFSSNKYDGAFIGTDVFGSFEQTVPTQNYGRVNAGVFGTHKGFEWKLAYTGLFGEKLQDNAASVKFAYRF